MREGVQGDHPAIYHFPHVIGRSKVTGVSVDSPPGVRQPKCPSCGEVDRLDITGPGNASCLACAAAFAPLLLAFASLKRAGIEGTKLQEILVREGTKHTACLTCADMFTSFPMLGETLHACVPCQAVWLRNGALLHFASFGTERAAAHPAVATSNQTAVPTTEQATEGAAAQLGPAPEPPPPPPLMAPPSAAAPSMGSPGALEPSPIEARSRPPSSMFDALDPPVPSGDPFSLDPPLPPSGPSFLDEPMPPPVQASAAASPAAPATPMPPTATTTRAAKPSSRAMGTSSGGSLDPEETLPRSGKAASRKKAKLAAPGYEPEASSPPALRWLLVLVVVAGAAFAGWRLVTPSASTALGGGKGVSFGKNVVPLIEPIALGTRAATKFTADHNGGELTAWYVPAAGSDHPGSGDLLLVQILGKGVRLVGVPRNMGELTVMTADVKVGDKVGRARGFFTGKDAWILLAASTTDGFGLSRDADHFLSSLSDLR
jgi:hypothetical protein